eukprot:Hpha_TRINITY_DN26975_c0_g1::TRINITY_DN26975_c0_g1_i1::g.24866::m.24866
MAVLRHHIGVQAPPHRPSLIQAVEEHAPAADEEDPAYLDVVLDCQRVQTALAVKNGELEELIVQRMAVPYPYSLIIFGPRGVGKTAMFIQLEKQLSSRARDLQETVRSIASDRSPCASPVPLPSISPTGEGPATSSINTSFAAAFSKSVQGDRYTNTTPVVGPSFAPSPAAPPTPPPSTSALLVNECLRMAGADVAPLDEGSELTALSDSMSPKTSLKPGNTPHFKPTKYSKAASAAQLKKKAEIAYAHKEWRRSRVNLQSIQFYLAAVEDASFRPWVVDLFLWDVNDPRAAGMFYYGAKCVCLMFDCNDSSSFEQVKTLHAEAKRVSSRSSFILIGNKADLREEHQANPRRSSSGAPIEPPAPAEVENFCEAEGMKYFECSALDSSSVEHLTNHVQGQVESSTKDHWAEEAAVPGSAERRVDMRVDKAHQEQERLTGVPRREHRRPSLARLAALRRNDSLARMKARFQEHKAGAIVGRKGEVEREDSEAEEEEWDEQRWDFKIGEGPNVLWPDTVGDTRRRWRADEVRGVFNRLDEDGVGSVTREQFLGLWRAAGESEEGGGALLDQFLKSPSDRLSFAEFGLILLRLGPRRGEAFLFPTRGVSAFDPRPRGELSADYQLLNDTFGEDKMYPPVGKRSGVFHPHSQSEMLRIFNSLQPEPDGRVPRETLRLFLRQYSPDPDGHQARALRAYPERVSLAEFAMLVAQVPNPLSDPAPTPFLLRCRGMGAKFPEDQSKVPVTGPQLRKHWRQLVARVPDSEPGCPARVPTEAVCDWVLSNLPANEAPPRVAVRTYISKANGHTPSEFVGYQTFAATALRFVSAS